MADDASVDVDPHLMKFVRYMSQGDIHRMKEMVRAAAAESPRLARDLVNGMGYRLPPLVLAAAGCPPAVIQLLIDEGADLDRTATYQGLEEIRRGSTALHVAASHGRIEVVEILLRAGSTPNVSDTLGYTPLMMSTRNEERQHDAAIAWALLREGADPMIEDRAGGLALHHAAGRGSVEVVELLVAAVPSSLNRSTSTGATALFLAATTPGLEKTVSRLLSLGATNRAILGNGSCPLTGAVHYGLRETVRVLLKEGWDAVGGAVALPRAIHLAAIKDFPGTLWLLLNAEGARGARGREEEEVLRRRWSRCVHDGRSVLHPATAADSPRAVSVLLACGANDGTASKIFNLYNIASPLPGKHKRDLGRKAAVRRTVARAAAYRARPWLWPPPVEADAVAVARKSSSSAGRAVGIPTFAADGKCRGRPLGVRICRPRSSAWLVNLIGRHSLKR
ncbi:unnamed protein product [Scytosiphon promiscuus]